MNLGQSIRTGVKWLFVGDTGGQVLQFVFGIVLARLLVPADFGMIVTIQVFTGLVGIFATGGMGQSLVRAKEADTDDFNAVFTLQLALGVTIYIGFLVSAPWIAKYLDNPLYADLLRVSAVSFLLRPFAFIRLTWLNREMQFKKRSQVTLTTGLLSGLASIGMAAAGLGVWSLVLSGLVSALAGNILYAFATPLHPRLLFQSDIIRKHIAYGAKITTSEFLKHVKEQSINLILSKLGGPTFLGIFNKAESLARMPNRLITPATNAAVFRAMSKVQDDLDQTKYMYYRTITLLMVYIGPMLVGLWWVAEQFIGVIYGEKWMAVVEPMKIILLTGVLRTIYTPSSMVLAVQNRLTQDVIGEAIGLVFSVTACIIGLTWGLAGVAWALVLSTVFYAVYFYFLAYRTIRTRIADLLRAAAPALLLNSLLCAVLAAAHFLLGALGKDKPTLYLAIMIAVGGTVYTGAFLFLPIPALQEEAARWRQKFGGVFALISRPFR